MTGKLIGQGSELPVPTTKMSLEEIRAVLAWREDDEELVTGPQLDLESEDRLEVQRRFMRLWDELLSARQKAFLVGFVTAGNLAGAQRLTKVASATHKAWLGKAWAREKPEILIQPYRECFEACKQIVHDQMEALLDQRVKEGFEEEQRLADGTVKFRRTRHDSSLIKMQLQAEMPQKYGKEGGDQNVQIVVVRE